MVSRTWYVSCSPRSPEKIIPELTQLARLEGKSWSERDKAGGLVNQIKFARFLQELPSFEGSISKNEPAFSARDRLAPMQTYGFAFIDSNRIIRITKAGHRLIEGVRIQELFLKQMLKWQYPSWQHGGNTRTRHLYPPTDQMGIHPFMLTLKVCYELEGISKDELAIFLLPVLHKDKIQNCIDKIIEFREGKKRLSGIERREFIWTVHLREFAKVYNEELELRQYHTRESLTATELEFLLKKARNSLDVADAAFRYFRATGIFTLSADYRRLAVSPMYRQEARRIINELKLVIIDHSNVDAFYEYMGNPDIPQLPWENQEELFAKAVTLGVNDKIARASSIIELKNLIEEKTIQSKEQKMQEYLISAQSQEEAQDIIQVFNRIRQKDVVEPPLFFEWNVWRAFVSMDDCENPKPNFNVDDDLKPFSTAPGNKADMEIYYNESFVVLAEVTLSGGARQYDTEGEPVTRHIGRFQREESERMDSRTVYGLFVAPRINPATRDYFYVHLKHLNNPEFGGYLNMVILNTEQFIDVFLFAKSLREFNRNILKDLMERIVNLREVTETGQEWGRYIPRTIEEWKMHWAS